MDSSQPNRAPKHRVVARPVPGWVLVVREPLSQYERAQVKHAKTSIDVAVLVGPRIEREVVEVMYVVCLNGNLGVLHLAEVSRGSVSSTAIRAMDVFRPAVACGATAVILVHNHPSGNPTPSPDDIRLTEAIVEAGKILGIMVADHVIISAHGKHESFFNLGLIGT